MVYFLPGHVINIITLLAHCHTSIQQHLKKKNVHFINTHSMVSVVFFLQPHRLCSAFDYVLTALL